MYKPDLMYANKNLSKYQNRQKAKQNTHLKVNILSRESFLLQRY